MSILVWRLWDVGYNNYLNKYELYGMYATTWYVGEVKRATCRIHYFQQKDPVLNGIYLIDHANVVIPCEGCACGIYGYKPDSLPDLPDHEFYSEYVVGVAELWGKIIVAEHGYRAQYGRLRALVDNETVARDYGVPNLPSIDYAQKEFFS